jgi:hypothetical protein
LEDALESRCSFLGLVEKHGRREPWGGTIHFFKLIGGVRLFSD